MSPKQTAIEAIQSLPDDASWEDIIERFEIICALDRARAEADAGRLISNEEAMRTFDRWRDTAK